MQAWKFIALIVGMAVAVGANAITFTLHSLTGTITVGSNTLVSGATFSSLGNSIKLVAPNAKVGDGEAIRAGVVQLIYDARTDASWVGISQTFSLQGFLRGSGTLSTVEDIFELDASGFEVGAPIATITSPVFTSADPVVSWSATRQFSRAVSRLRAKKTIFISALPDTQAFDYSQLGIINQSVEIIPEPATIAALGFGLAVIAARRRRR